VGGRVINFFSLSEGKKNHGDKSANDFLLLLSSSPAAGRNQV